MEALGILIGLVVALVAGALVLALSLGWAVLVGVGLYRLRRGAGGRGLVVGGALWGALAVVAAIALLRAGSAYFGGFAPTPFDAAEYESETGEVHLTWTGPCELILSRSAPQERWLLSDEGGRLAGPAGHFVIWSWTLKATDEHGRAWSARGAPWGPPGPTEVQIAPDHPVRLEVGPPFRARVQVDTFDQDQIHLALSLVGREGTEHTLAPEGRPTAPRFEVRDAAGQVIWSGDFEFG